MRPSFVASVALATLTALGAAAPRLAAAQEPSSQREAFLPPSPAPVSDASEDAEVTVWYGYQNLGVDAAALLVLTLGTEATDGNEAVVWLGVGMYALGSPIVHAIHGDAGRTVGSVAMRLGLPVLGGAIGIAAAQPCREDSHCYNELGGMLVGGLVGVLTAVAIDDFALARETRPARPSWAPTFTAARDGGMTFGVAGAF